ncbi:transcriptional regulator, GntR family [Bacillus sp. OV194]|nr:transcriptional regulator, GntR family [Bacillus sp. OV194]
MFESTQFTKTSVSKKVVDYIKGLIMDKKLVTGEKLPSEREMSERLNISRNTVREAYQILATLGFVEIKHGQGVFVSNESTSVDQWAAAFFVKNDQIVELFEMRRVLETQSVKWAAENASEDQLKKLEHHVNYSYTLAEDESNEHLIVKADQEFHLMLAEFSGNSILYRIMCNLIDLLKEVRNETMEIPGRLSKSIEEHKRIVLAVGEKDPVKAEEEMINHLESVRNELLRDK